MAEPNTRWQQPVPTTPRNTVAQAAHNPADGRTPKQWKVDQQWRDAIANGVTAQHPDSLNATAPGEDGGYSNPA